MPGVKEIKNRIDSIEETRKITNAMYLIASTKLRKAKRELDSAKPYFNTVRDEIKTVFSGIRNVDSPYFPSVEDAQKPEGVCALLVITADKGLAGAYNHNVLNLAHRLMARHPKHRLFVVGEYGRQHFISQKIAIEEDFLYSSNEPTFSRARNITGKILELYDKKEIQKFFIVYTDYGNGSEMQETFECLLPLKRADFEIEEEKENEFEFHTDGRKVIESIVPSYLEGYVYSALTDSYCCEQNSRMTAMDSAGRNAEKLLSEVRMQYNHARQAGITQEISEISAAAKYQREKAEKREKKN